MSGIGPSPFLFYGFLNSKSGKQITELKSLKDYKSTMIFYESVHRMKETLENMLNVFGDRSIAVARELSKIHEEISRGKISEILPLVDDMKGEFVIVVEGNKPLTVKLLDASRDYWLRHGVTGWGLVIDEEV